MRIDEIKKEVESLHNMLQDPEPGLSTWMSFLKESLGKLHDCYEKWDGYDKTGVAPSGFAFEGQDLSDLSKEKLIAVIIRFHERSEQDMELFKKAKSIADDMDKLISDSKRHIDQLKA